MSQAELNEVRMEINKAVLSLPRSLQTIAVLRFMENLSYRQIALRLNLSEASVRNRLSRSRKRLYKKLEPLLMQFAGGD